MWRSALFQPEGVRGVHVRGLPCGDKCCRERLSGEDQCGGGDRCRIGGGAPEQLGLDQLAEGDHASERDGHSGNRGEGIDTSSFYSSTIDA
jgi:hypothetical protein